MLCVCQVSKLEERILKINSQLEKLVKQEQVEGYEEKVWISHHCVLLVCCVCVQVPIEVRDATREKIESLETERSQLEGALAGFRSMKE